MSPSNPFEAIDSPDGMGEEQQTMLRQTRAWVWLLSVGPFLGAAFVALFVVLITVGMTTATLFGNGEGPSLLYVVPGVGIYGVVACVYGALGIFMVQMGRSMGQLADGGGSEAMSHMIRATRNFWRTLGVFLLSLFILSCAGWTAGMTYMAWYPHEFPEPSPIEAEP
ncbi:MAG: hypothetical protein KTR31_10415 [Myxococcales bacterium]|nr:hypothetical protein [Myxococcales bacterium]